MKTSIQQTDNLIALIMTVHNMTCMDTVKHISKTIHIYNHFVSFVEYIHVILKKYEINIRIPFSESFFLFGERAKLVCNVEKSLLVGILETSSAIPAAMIGVNTPSVCCRFLGVCSIFPVVYQTTGKLRTETCESAEQTVSNFSL